MNAEEFSHSKRPRSEDVSQSVQSFAESAAKQYRQWEAEKAEVENEGYKNFLELKTDPFGQHEKGFVIWIRKCY